MTISLQRAPRFQWLRDNGELLILLALPLILLLANPLWFANKFGDIDTWFYYGHFKALFQVDHTVGPLPYDYYRTRLPYILPGAVLYKIFSEITAQFLFMALIYCSTITSFWYILRCHTTRPVAFAGTALMALDIYFLRSIGWQYVDNGIVAYQALTFAFLAAAARKKHAPLWLVLAGFSAMSMLFIHLGSGLVLLMAAAYAVWVFGHGSSYRMVIGRMIPVIGYVLLGVLICLALYGFLNNYYYHTGYFPLREQLRVAREESQSLSAATSLLVLAKNGYWLSFHCGVLLASVVALIAALCRREKRTFSLMCLSSAFVLLSTVTALEVTHRAYFLSREGLYISFFFVPSYLAAAAMLFRTEQISWRVAALAFIAPLASLSFRLLYSDGAGLQQVFPIPMFVLAAAIGAVLTIPVFFRRTWATIVALLLLCIINLWVPWWFKKDDSVLTATQAIRAAAGNRIPRIYFDGNDPIGKSYLWSVVATFTERGTWRHGEDYPDLSKVAYLPYFDFEVGDLIVVLSSTIASGEEAGETVRRWVDKAPLVASFRIERPDRPLWVHCFTIEQLHRISYSTEYNKQRRPDGSLPGSALSAFGGAIDGEARTATEGKMAAGVLTFGPYVHIAPGSYTATFRYNAEGSGHNWDLLGETSGNLSVLAKGDLPSTQGQDRDITIPFTATTQLNNFQARSFFSGQGKLSIKGLTIKDQSSPPR